MKSKIIKSIIVYGIIVLFLAGVLMAASFTPQGNIDLKNVFNVTNVPYINGINFTLFYNNFISSNSSANARIDSVNSSLQTQIGRIDNINSTLNSTNYTLQTNIDSANSRITSVNGTLNSVNSTLDSKINSVNSSLNYTNYTLQTNIDSANTRITSVNNTINGRVDSINSTINNNNASWSRTDNATYDAYLLANKSNSTTWWADVSGWVSGWFAKNGNNLEFNETKLNNSIADNPKNWTSLQNYPVGCPADTFITNISDSTTCSSVGNSNSSSFWAGVSSFISKWFYNSGNVLNLNETQLNLTIQSNINGNLTDYYKKSQTYNNTANIDAGNYNLNITNITIGGHILWENSSGALIID